ncbi:MAG: hypothetical protein KDD61_12460 [Bdellovibrionales bacterium]|nr:hypothetical protein [Bdellovibrionales bacterium]
MKTSASIALLAALLMGTTAMAADSDTQSNETSAKASDVKPAKKNDIDTEITNARMRATSGSKSKFSFSTSANYQGGSVVNGFGEVRPNLNGNPSDLASTGIGASISARYRQNKNMSYTLGTSVNMLRPTKGVSGKVSTARGEVDRYYIGDPSLSASYAGKLGRYQMISSVGTWVATSSGSLDSKQVGGFDLSQNMLTTIGETGLTVGVALGLGWTSYSDYKQAAAEGQWDYTLGIYPYAEYSLNDTYSLRTVFGYFNYYHEVGSKESTLWNMKTANPYQSVGVGISVTRDVYLYPNIQFIPEEKNMAWDKTNVAISATINIL